MIVLDENFPESQRQILRGWRLHPRQIGYDIEHKGLKDNEIILYLQQLHKPTFFTLDADFYNRQFIHQKYCIVFIDAKQYEAAFFTRRLMRCKVFNSQTKRNGKIICVNHVGIYAWNLHGEKEIYINWDN